MNHLELQLKAAESAAQCLGTLQSAFANEDGTLTAVIHYAREFYFIVDIDAHSELLALHELKGTDIQCHGADSTLSAVVQLQIRYNQAQELLVDGFVTPLLLIPVGVSTGGDCCSVESGCCGGADQDQEESESDDEDNLILEEMARIFLFPQGEFAIFSGRSERAPIVEAEPCNSYEMTVELPSGVSFELELQWDGDGKFFVATEHGESYFELPNSAVYMVGNLTESGVSWTPHYGEGNN